MGEISDKNRIAGRKELISPWREGIGYVLVKGNTNFLKNMLMLTIPRKKSLPDHGGKGSPRWGRKQNSILRPN